MVGLAPALLCVGVMMIKTAFVTTVLLAIGCTTQQSSNKDYVLTGNTCAVYQNETACDQQADCEWSPACACPANEGPCPPCPAPVCVAKGGSEGSGSGGGGSGSAIAGCACSDGGVCFEQIGGPATQAGGPDIQCYPPSACPGGCGNVCDEIVGEGKCTPDANVANMCICDNGIR